MTRGFPSLEELIRNGSLLERYSINDEDLKLVSGVRFTCSEADYRIKRITYVALPGDGMTNISLVFQTTRPPIIGVTELVITDDVTPFSEFGHILELNSILSFNEGTLLFIRHHPFEEGHSRLVYQREMAICSSESQSCPDERDYPLLAIETG